MKKIGLIDVDGHDYPNLALMKISAYHKSIGDIVEFATIGEYDIIYKSKVFTFTPDVDNNLITSKQVFKGGTGYDITSKLPMEIEKICPDYTLYPIMKWNDKKRLSVLLLVVVLENVIGVWSQKKREK